jgi:hypothetical protein
VGELLVAPCLLISSLFRSFTLLTLLEMAELDEFKAQKYSLQNVAFRSIKRSRDIFLSEYGKLAPVHEERFAITCRSGISPWPKPRGKAALQDKR